MSDFPVSEGDVVVHAAAGGVGLLLTQMVKRCGAVVVATTSTTEKAALARQAGADHVTGYADFGRLAKEVSGGAGAAVVYDGVGATYPLEDAARAQEDLAARRTTGKLLPSSR